MTLGPASAGATDTKDGDPGEDRPRRRPGRPKGSKNKKTLEREAEIERQKAAGTYVEPPKRRRGRPKGSKNKKTLEREAAAGAEQSGWPIDASYGLFRSRHGQPLRWAHEHSLWITVRLDGSIIAAERIWDVITL